MRHDDRGHCLIQLRWAAAFCAASLAACLLIVSAGADVQQKSGAERSGRAPEQCWSDLSMLVQAIERGYNLSLEGHHEAARRIVTRALSVIGYECGTSSFRDETGAMLLRFECK